MSILIYARIKNEAIISDCAEQIPKLEQWFADHPDRDVCNVRVWYGKTIKVKRPKSKRSRSIAAQLEAARDAALA